MRRLRPWLAARLELPIGPLFCVIDGPTRGRPWRRTGGRPERRWCPTSPSRCRPIRQRADVPVPAAPRRALLDRRCGPPERRLSRDQARATASLRGRELPRRIAGASPCSARACDLSRGWARGIPVPRPSRGGRVAVSQQPRARALERPGSDGVRRTQHQGAPVRRREVRRALSFAIDRDAAVEADGGSHFAARPARWCRPTSSATGATARTRPAE